MIEVLALATFAALIVAGCLMFLLFALDSRLRAVESAVFPDDAARIADTETDVPICFPTEFAKAVAAIYDRKERRDTETEIPDEPVSDQFPVYEKFPIVHSPLGSSK